MTPESQLPEVEQTPKPDALLGVAIPFSLIVAVLLLLLFGWISEEVLTQHTRNFDTAVRAAIHQYSSPALTRAAVFASLLGGDVLVGGFFIALTAFLRLRWRRAAVWLTITTAGALVLDLALKHFFHRTRPTPFFGSLPHSYSFPSGHALLSFCFYGVLAGLLADRIKPPLFRILIWAVAVILIISIGLSRIYLGVHYPTDVIAGYLAAAVWVSTMIAVDHWRTRRNLRTSG